jgi:predicted nucleic acid-binding Zn ribbon protein
LCNFSEKNMTEQIKKCPECGDPIKGRTDKKFCSDMCRNSYNNRQNSDVNNYVRNVNNILRKNRRIIENLIPKENELTKTTKNKLIEKGFHFGYHTNSHTTQKGDTYYFCYEFGFLPLENDYYLLVKRKES